MSELLEEEAGNTDAEWLLWMSVRGMIANPAFAFPLIKVPVRRMPCMRWHWVVLRCEGRSCHIAGIGYYMHALTIPAMRILLMIRSS